MSIKNRFERLRTHRHFLELYELAGYDCYVYEGERAFGKSEYKMYIPKNTEGRIVWWPEQYDLNYFPEWFQEIYKEAESIVKARDRIRKELK